jgi:hypothetical protein
MSEDMAETFDGMPYSPEAEAKLNRSAEESKQTVKKAVVGIFLGITAIIIVVSLIYSTLLNNLPSIGGLAVLLAALYFVLIHSMKNLYNKHRRLEICDNPSNQAEFLFKFSGGPATPVDIPVLKKLASMPEPASVGEAVKTGAQYGVTDALHMMNYKEYNIGMETVGDGVLVNFAVIGYQRNKYGQLRRERAYQSVICLKQEDSKRLAKFIGETLPQIHLY